MANSKNKRRQRKRFSFLLFPIIAFVFLLGWCLYSTGGNKRKKQATPKRPPKKDNVTILPIILEENEEIENR